MLVQSYYMMLLRQHEMRDREVRDSFLQLS